MACLWEEAELEQLKKGSGEEKVLFAFLDRFEWRAIHLSNEMGIKRFNNRLNFTAHRTSTIPSIAVLG
jgi:hypothetical protein